MRPARILLVSTPVGALGTGAGGGVELTVLNTAATLQARGHRVTVVAPAGSRLDVEGVALIERSGAPPPSAQHQDRATPIVMPADGALAGMCDAAFAAQDDVDLIVNYAYDWLPLYLTPFFRTPMLHLVGMGSLTDAIDGAIAAALAHRPGGIAVHTRAQAATFPFGDRLAVVGNGVDVGRYRFRPQGGPSLGWVARIAPEKGLEDAVAAASRVELPLDVWGIVEDEAYWADVRRRFPAEAIRYHGFLPTDDLQAALGECRAMLVTPQWDEAFGNVVVEAMATGVPVITYDRGGPAELVRDGETGFVVEAGSVTGLVEAISRVGEIDRAACRRVVEAEHSLDALAGRLEAWFEPFC